MEGEQLYALIMDYEENNLSVEQMLELFQYLLDSGFVWRMPTRYLDVVGRMVANGHIKMPRKEQPYGKLSRDEP